MLVLPRDGDATLVVPALEAPRVVERPDVFALRPVGRDRRPDRDRGRRWSGRPARSAIGDHTWARFVLDLQARAAAAPVLEGERGHRPAPGGEGRRRDRGPRAGPRRPSTASRPTCRRGRSRSSGRTEAEVSADLGRRILAEGHHRVNFAIVAAGANAASPHHEAGARVDRGRRGRAVRLRRHHARRRRRRLLLRHHPLRRTSASRRPRSPRPTPCCTRRSGRRWPPPPSGTPCEDVDAAARDVIAAAGYGDQFIHRTGHGIGVEEHEDPYIVVGQRARRWRPATRSRSSPASTCPAGSACASRTSWSRPTTGPTS